MHQVVVPMAKPNPAYNGRAVSGPGVVHQGSYMGSLRMNRPNFLRVRGERCPRPLMTSTMAGQGFDKSIEKSMGRHGSR